MAHHTPNPGPSKQGQPKQECPRYGSTKHGSSKHNQALAKTKSTGNKTGTAGSATFDDKRPEAQLQTQQIGMIQRAALTKNTTQNKSPSPVKNSSLKKNNGGLPDDLKAGIERLSGYSMADVKVHYNSPKPIQLNAHAYAQGTDIHIASGQEQHLPHEAWHVVQQKQHRVKPGLPMKAGIAINDESELEKEADIMGEKALQLAAIHPESSSMPAQNSLASTTSGMYPIQRRVLVENETSTGYDPVSLAKINEAVKTKGYTPADIPMMPQVIEWFHNHGEYEVDHINRIIPEINRELEKRYLQSAESKAPHVMNVLDDEHKIAFSYYLQMANYNHQQLQTLVQRATNAAHIDTDSVNGTLNSIIKPLNSGFSSSIKDANRPNMIQGKNGELIGLEGELNAALSMPVPADGNQVTMGQMLNINEDGDQQDVDLYYDDGEISGRHAIEVAATVSKLRDKLSQNAQFDRYTQLREHQGDLTLGYAVGETGNWLDLFASSPAVNKLIQGQRELHIDGSMLSPDDLQHILTSYQRIEHTAFRRLPPLGKSSRQILSELWHSPADALRESADHAEQRMLTKQLGAGSVDNLRDYELLDDFWQNSKAETEKAAQVIINRSSGSQDPLRSVATRMNQRLAPLDLKIKHHLDELKSVMHKNTTDQNRIFNIPGIYELILQRNQDAIDSLQVKNRPKFKAKARDYNNKVINDALERLTTGFAQDKFPTDFPI